MILKKVLLILIELPLYMISFLVPKNKTIWLFGAWRGKLYSDNSKYLFEYMNKYHKNIRSVWVSSDKNVVRSIREKGYEAYHFYSLVGILLALRASVVFQTEGSKDINSFCCGRAKVIQLWHGTPLKKIISDVNSLSKQTFKSKIASWLLPYKATRKSSDYVTVASEFVADSFLSAYKTTHDRILITGLARTDAYKNNKSNKYIDTIKEKTGYSKLVVYLPTHRQEGRLKAQFSLEELLEVDNKLRDVNVHMLFKPHFHEIKHYKNFRSKFSNIIIPDNEESLSDVYSFIYSCDMLITDYSSIYFDYLYADSPILFYTYDYDKYINETGLYYNYEDVTPGPKCKTWDEIIEEISKQIKKDEWKDNRLECMRLFNDYSDGENCRRIWENTTDILNNQKPRNMFKG